MLPSRHGQPGLRERIWQNGNAGILGVHTYTGLGFRWTPYPVIVTIMDNKDYIRVPLIFLLYHYYRVGGPSNIYSYTSMTYVYMQGHITGPRGIKRHVEFMGMTPSSGQ